MSKVIQLTATLKAEFTDNEIQLRYPLRTIKIPIGNIKGFYIYPFLGSKDICIISYYKGDKSKTAKICIQESSTKSFISILKEVTPGSADLLDKNKADALRLLGTRDTRILNMVIVAIVVMIIGCSMLLPTIWHIVFDTHLASTTIEDLYAGKLPDSRYVTFSARLGESGLVTTRRNIRHATRTRRAYFHILPEQWHVGDPVRAVIMINNNRKLLREINTHTGETIQVTGVIRNVLWETIFPGGLTDIFSFDIFSRWQEQLSTKINSPVNDPLLIEYQIESKKQAIHDMWLTFIALLIPLTVVIFKFTVKYLKTK